jgi:alpha-2,3 sialyltransferase
MTLAQIIAETAHLAPEERRALAEHLRLVQPADTRAPRRDSVVICGNGPSLAQIDYRRFPDDADIWRCNKFFLEEKYYVGRKVDGYVFGGDDSDMPAIYRSLKRLSKDEYDISFQNIFAQFYAPTRMEKMCHGFAMSGQNNTCLWKHVFEVLNENFTTAPTLARLLAEQLVVEDIVIDGTPSLPHAGTCLLALAVLLKYKNIYVVGIDNNHSTTSQYPWSKKGDAIAGAHNHEVQYKIITAALNTEGVNLYSLSPKSPLTDIVPLAPVLKETSSFDVSEKKKRELSDYLPASDRPYGDWNETLTEMKNFIRQLNASGHFSGDIHETKVGEKICFNAESTVTAFLIYGWSAVEPWGTWTDGCHADALLPISSAAKEIKLEFHSFPAPTQLISVGIGSQTFDFTVDAGPDKVITIPLSPSSFRVIRGNNFLYMRFHLKDAARPCDANPENKDSRQLAMGLISATIY